MLESKTQYTNKKESFEIKMNYIIKLGAMNDFSYLFVTISTSYIRKTQTHSSQHYYSSPWNSSAAQLQVWWGLVKGNRWEAVSQFQARAARLLELMMR